MRAVILVALGLLALPGRASAQELTGTHVRYLRVGPNGRLCDSAATPRSLAYSELGGEGDVSCDVFGPGSPAVGFTVRAVDGVTELLGSNYSLESMISTLTGPTVEGRSIVWTGRLSVAPGRGLHVTQTYAYEPLDRYATLRVVLRNEGPSALTDVRYFFSGDPDHGWCVTGGSYETRNDVVRQPPADGSAVATASATTGLRYTLAIGSFDPRARANNGGFENRDVVAAWDSPVDRGGAIADEDIGLAFREARLEAGASTTFVLIFAFGRTVEEALERFDLSANAPNGRPCSRGASCASGFCVDGVCCDAACGDGAGDCQACSVAAGAPTNGTCAVLAPSHVCRSAAGPCDVAETCTGASTACPPDTLAGAGAVCRPSSDLCDAPERCSGTGSACPPDALAVSGFPCRPAAGDCDVEETCTGIGASCPPDVRVPAGTLCRASRGECDVAELCAGSSACPEDERVPEGTTCRASTGPCDAAEACDGANDACPDDAARPDGTMCGDGLVCNGVERCEAGVCASGSPFCDDGDPCTVDACDELAGCSRTPVPRCCRADADCDDGDACTDDACEGSRCVSTQRPRCGEEDASVPRDAATAADGGMPADAGPASMAGGCGCRASGRGDGGLATVLAGLLALLLRRRRRA